MSFRIHVEPAASELLRSLSSHVVAQIGRAVAELAESAPVAQGPVALASGRLELGDCAVLYSFDHGARTLRITDIEEPADLSAIAVATLPGQAATARG